MKESLDAAKLLFQVMIITAVTLFAFALSIEKKSNIYLQAINEFKIFIDMREKIYEAQVNDLTNYYDTIGVTSTLSKLYMIGKKKIKITSATLLRSPISSSTSISNEKISDISDYIYNLYSDSAQYAWVVDQDSMPKKLRNLKFEFKNSGPVTFLLTGPSDKSGNITGDELAVQIFPDKDIRYEGFVARQTGRKSISAESAKKLLIAKRLLVIVPGGDPISLPELHEVWSLIGNLRIGEIDLALKKQAEQEALKTDSQLDLFGFKVKSKIAAAFGPIALLGISIYFLAHIMHISKIGGNHGKEIGQYPWVALFNDNFSKIITIFLIFALPSGSAVTLIYLSDITSSLKLIGIIGFFIVHLLISNLLFSNIIKIRHIASHTQ